MCNRRFIASGDVTSGPDFQPEVHLPPHVPQCHACLLYYSRPVSVLHAVFLSYKKPCASRLSPDRVRPSIT